ncbi:MAG: patatin-like phospholipase family protein [Oscillochloridaceae bacterium]|nr:patatin-like phospholipase family protein [Chloroflexaceae bacterium]MDW8389526.1 patatin-like phospholipase family protein [Oscillochloridaceae bacterium]
MFAPKPSGPIRVAIACQGGGSHTAFTAGVLKPLLRAEEAGRYKIVGLSGTSGGAICAALAWYGLMKQARGEWDRDQVIAVLDSFWRDNMAQSLWEQIWNAWTVSLVRLHASGKLPELKTSPYRPEVVVATELARRLAPRQEFFDLRLLLEKHLKLDEIPQPVIEPRLLIGAVAVLSGRFKAFDSMAAEISIDSILASTTLPTLFQGVRIGDEVYWDGLFSQNPPIREFLSKVDVSLKPDEIWIIRINRQEISEEPTSVEEIEDRRNALAGNISLNHEIDVINKINAWLADSLIRSKLSGLKPVAIHSIWMSDALREKLTFVSKLNRDPGFLTELMNDGEMQGEAFLVHREAAGW